jgi:TolB-like protein
VIARTSVMTYKGKAKTIEEIGRELQVGTVLEGSVRKAAHQVRVAAQLIKVQDQGHLWSQHYDRELQGVFAIQSDIAHRVTEALKGQLLTAEKQQIEKKGTESLDAYNLYLKGRYFFNKHTKEGIEKSKAYFEQAIAKDPNYALAYVGLADFYNRIPWFSNLSAKEAYPRAIAAAEKAVELDHTLAEAYTSLADAKLFEWDWSGGESAIKRAIQLNPNYAVARLDYSMHYLTPMLRRDEAIAEMKRALKLDPLSPVVNDHIGWPFLWARQYDQAIEQFQKALELDPNLPWSCIGLGEAYLLKGMYEQAISWYQKAVDVTQGWSTAVAFLGWAYGMVGKKDEAQRLLAELQERATQEPIKPIAFALVYMGLGERDHAFEWLQKAYEERSQELIHLRSGPIFSIPLGSDPRYMELAKKVGLPTE